MPATYNAEHLTSRSERRMVDFDPDSADPTIVDLDPAQTAPKLLPIATFRRFLAGVMRTVGTDGIDKFEVIAATDDAGSNATVVVSKTPTTANRIGDTVWLECDAAMIHEVLPAATHVGVRIELETATDECAVFFERAEPFYAYSGLTDDFVY